MAGIDDASSQAPPNYAGIDDSVHRAVITCAPVDEVKRVIEELAQGSDWRRENAVNKSGTNPETGKDETPLEAAHRLKLGPVVGALVVAGAEVSVLFNGQATALAVCIWHDQVDSVRALLEAGHDANAEIGLLWETDAETQLKCLELLVEVGKADLGAFDWTGKTPLHVLARYEVRDAVAVIGRFLALGADLEALNEDGQTPLFAPLEGGMIEPLLEWGASTAAIDNRGRTPLMHVIENHDDEAMVEPLLRASSDETRRVTDVRGDSAVDMLAWRCQDPDAEWQLRVVSELLRSGAPVKPDNLKIILGGQIERFKQLEGEKAARCSESRRWRAHDDLVQLAFDARDAREAEERVRVNEARVRELEEELRQRGEVVEEEEEEDGAEDQAMDEGAGPMEEGGDEEEKDDNESEGGAKGGDGDDQ